MDFSKSSLEKFQELDNELYQLFSDLLLELEKEKETFNKKVEKIILNFLNESTTVKDSKETLILYLKYYKQIIILFKDDYDFIRKECKPKLNKFSTHIYQSFEKYIESICTKKLTNYERNLLSKSTTYYNYILSNRASNIFRYMQEELSENSLYYLDVFKNDLASILLEYSPKIQNKLINFLNKNMYRHNVKIETILEFVEKCYSEEKLISVENENNIKKTGESLLNSYIDNTMEENKDFSPEVLEKSKDLNIDLEEKIKTFKIFNYKEMNSLAEKNGYVLKHCNATSHAIFEHSKTNKIVCIPQHSLGIGISKKIQKQIMEGTIPHE